jgi:Flp pilus assembly protein TadG
MMRARALRRLRFLRGEGGAALVEFAIILPLLLMIVFGIVDFARAFYTQNNLTSAVREGARWASVQPENNLSVASVQTVVKNFVNRGDGSAAKFGGPPIADPQILVTFSPALPNTASITVTINDYPFEWITPLPGMVGFGNITLSAEAVFRWEQTCAPNCS